MDAAIEAVETFQNGAAQSDVMDYVNTASQHMAAISPDHVRRREYAPLGR